MSEENKAVARRFYSSISSGNLGVIDEVVAEDVIERKNSPVFHRAEKSIGV